MQIHFHFHYNFKFILIELLFYHIICEDEGSYDRQDTRDTKFGQKIRGFPYWDFHNHSLNFSSPAQRGSQTILTISEYGCCTTREHTHKKNCLNLGIGELLYG